MYVFSVCVYVGTVAKLGVRSVIGAGNELHCHDVRGENFGGRA